MPGAVVRLLERDHELGEDLNPARLAAATERAQTTTITLPRGPWEPPEWLTDYPEVYGRLMGRALRRSRRLGVEG